MSHQILFENIKAEVFKRRPVLEEINRKFGHFKLKDYISRAWEVPMHKPNEVFVSIVEGYLTRLYGKEVADGAKNQLLKKPLISTIDHLGFWGHPIFVNADLIYSLHFKKDEFAISLATESVSLNNTSSWSGSVLLHGNDGGLRRYSFFPDKLKTLPVFSAPAISNINISRFAAHFGQGAASVLNALGLIIPSASEESLNHKPWDANIDLDFSNQACKASFNLWQKVFPSAPKFLYLPLESIVLEYIKNILHDNENIITQLITTPKGRKLWQKYFGQEHTFMFWEIDEKGRRQSLNKLPGLDEIYQLLKNRRLYASSPLCFMALLYVGFACVGGFTQTTWLTQVKEKFVSLLKELQGENDGHSPNLEDIPTKNFAESSLAHLILGGRQVKPTSLDLFLTGKDYYADYVKKAQSLTLAESLNLAIPDIYKVVVPLRERF